MSSVNETEVDQALQSIRAAAEQYREVRLPAGNLEPEIEQLQVHWAELKQVIANQSVEWPTTYVDDINSLSTNVHLANLKYHDEVKERELLEGKIAKAINEEQNSIREGEPEQIPPMIDPINPPIAQPIVPSLMPTIEQQNEQQNGQTIDPPMAQSGPSSVVDHTVEINSPVSTAQRSTVTTTVVQNVAKNLPKILNGAKIR